MIEIPLDISGSGVILEPHMDDEALRDELEQRRAAHNGDVAAAVEDVLNEVFQELDEAVVDSKQELAEANALLKMDSKSSD